MQKFLAVVRHEYRKVVLKWSFLIGTLLLPFLAACFAVVPAIILSLKGEPTRIVIVDPTGKIESRLKANLSSEKIEAKARKAMEESFKDIDASQQERMKRNTEQFASGFHFVDFDSSRIPLSDIRSTLNLMITRDEIDA